MPDVFISYSRKDTAFVRQLVDRLKVDQRDVWVDFEDIPFAAEWWDEICAGIDTAETAIFVISPDSLESKVCSLEISYAARNKKRIVPILYRDPAGKPVLEQISHINWIYFNEAAKFDDSFRKLIETMDTDLEALKSHTRLLIRAREWEKKGHNPSLLLRGDDLAEARQVLSNPAVTDLQTAYLEASSLRERRAQMIWRFVFGFAGAFLGVAFWIFNVYREAFVSTPQRVQWILAYGQALGLFVGLQSVLVENLPMRWDRRLTVPARTVLRIAACLLLGIAAWYAVAYFLESTSGDTRDWLTFLIGGVGLAGGFIWRNMVKAPSWVDTLLTIGLTWGAIWFTWTQVVAGTGLLNIPLVYVDDESQLLTVMLPMVILIAVGANAAGLWREVRGLLKRDRVASENTGKKRKV
jgi:hypothetical protein